MQMCRHLALGCVLGVLVLAAQVGPARAYDCTSDAECAYEGCNDISCSSSSTWCNNGVWDAFCGVSTTYTSTTKQAETLCTVLPLFPYHFIMAYFGEWRLTSGTLAGVIGRILRMAWMVLCAVFSTFAIFSTMAAA